MIVRLLLFDLVAMHSMTDIRQKPLEPTHLESSISTPKDNFFQSTTNSDEKQLYNSQSNTNNHASYENMYHIKLDEKLNALPSIKIINYKIHKLNNEIRIINEAIKTTNRRILWTNAQIQNSNNDIEIDNFLDKISIICVVNTVLHEIEQLSAKSILTYMTYKSVIKEDQLFKIIAKTETIILKMEKLMQTLRCFINEKRALIYEKENRVRLRSEYIIYKNNVSEDFNKLNSGLSSFECEVGITTKLQRDKEWLSTLTDKIIYWKLSLKSQNKHNELEKQTHNFTCTNKVQNDYYIKEHTRIIRAIIPFLENLADIVNVRIKTAESKYQDVLKCNPKNQIPLMIYEGKDIQENDTEKETVITENANGIGNMNDDNFIEISCI